ncbi:MAG: phosphomannomutase/phosphoglucomutase [Bacteroidales bacterium]|nr:phosphomannomutase/phosphoglucomutase [Bacteroidales bacterium]
MNAFKAYDIRGVYGIDFTKEDIYKIGYFLPQLLKTTKILIGRDVRVSSDEIYDHLKQGINDAGADVYNAGLTTTPMIYWATAKYNFAASVQITASHNPKEYNGLKVSREEALPVGYETGLAELEQMINDMPVVPVINRGEEINFSFRNDYLEFLNNYQRDHSNLKIGIDCSNGMAALLIKDLLGNAPIYIFDTLDGTFPNHEANPLIPANVKDLKKLVLDNNCDIGVIFDGDADRVMFVDEKGQFIRPDLIIGVLAHHFLTGEAENVLQDIRTSEGVREYIEKFGGKMHMWKVGRAYAALKLRDIDGIFGGELAGHYYFRDFYYSDSGLLACLLVLNIISDMKNHGVSVSQLISQISTYANSGEINFRIEKKTEAMQAVKDHFTKAEKPQKFYDFDGYRIEFHDWWFNIRPSNTEPFLRFIAEAKDEEKLQKVIKEVNLVLGAFQ